MSRTLLINPYDGIDWGKAELYKGDFHQHSTESDGTESVALLIDQAEDSDLDMFVVSDHDSYRIDRGRYPKVLDVSDSSAEYYDPERPTGRYRNTFPFHYFDHDIYYDPNGNRNYTVLAREGIKGEFDIENDLIKGMLTFPACEFTEKHHIISILSDADGFPGNYNEDFVLNQSESRDGLTYFAHPGDFSDAELGRSYDKQYSAEWYKMMLEKYSSCLGLEIINQNDRFYNDRKLWDHVNNIGFHAHRVWGFSGSDSHGTFHDHHYNTVFMENLTLEELKTRLINGNFYCSIGKGAPVIDKIEVDGDNIIIETDIDNTIEWISGGLTIHKGNTIDYKITKGISKYVRAVARNSEGESYTNPFYFNRFVKPKGFI